MTRHPFGWSLPPGVTDRMIDEAAGAYDQPDSSDYEFPFDDDQAYWDDVSILHTILGIPLPVIHRMHSTERECLVDIAYATQD